MTRLKLAFLALLLFFQCGPIIIQGGGSAGPTELFTEDWEDGSTCATLGYTATGNANCDFATSPAPLTGSYSANTYGYNGGSGGATSNIIIGTGNFDCTGSKTCRVMLEFHAPADAGNGPNSAIILGGDAETVLIGEYDCGPGNPDLRATCTDVSGSYVEVLVGTTYYLCLEYDLVNDDGVLYIDSDGDYCNGDVGTSTCDDTVTNRTAVDQITLHADSGDGDFVFDEIVVEEE